MHTLPTESTVSLEKLLGKSEKPTELWSGLCVLNNDFFIGIVSVDQHHLITDDGAMTQKDSKCGTIAFELCENKR